MVYVQLTENGVQVKASQLIMLSGKTAISHYWALDHLIRHSDTPVVGLHQNFHLVITRAKKMPSKKLIQAFREGENHCVFEPLIMLFQSYYENSETVSSKQRYKGLVKRLKGLAITYDKGVPENKLEEIGKIISRRIVMHNVVGNEIKSYNNTSPRDFHFTNTRGDHVEQGFLTLDKQFTSVSKEELRTIQYNHDKEGKFYLFSGDMYNNIPQSIRSAEGAWAVYNKNFEVFTAFNQSQGIPNYALNGAEYPELTEFIQQGCVVHSAVVPLDDDYNDLTDAKMLDIEKAYTQHKYAPGYKGFMGHIQQWRKFKQTHSDFIKTHLGIYQFKHLVGGALNQRGIWLEPGETYILPSPEIEMRISYGMEIELLAGCWGSRFDIEYTEEMLDERRYCEWAGKLMMDKSKQFFVFPGNAEWASHLTAELGEENVRFYANCGKIQLRYSKKAYNVLHHITAFITSYTRMNIMALMVSGIQNDCKLLKVVLDGLYYKGDIPDVHVPCHTDKKLITHLGTKDNWYDPSDIDTSTWAEYNGLDGNVVLLGAGGTGKSYSIANDRGLITPLYVIPQHTLGRKSRAVNGWTYTTIHKLIGQESKDADGKVKTCLPYKDDHREPGIIFIDELTMIEGTWIDKAITLYPNSMFIIAGDIDTAGRWFQCRNGHPGAFSTVWKPPASFQFITYETDYRASGSPELQELKKEIREEMKKIMQDSCDDGGQIDAIRLSHWFSTTYTTTPFSDAVAMFAPGDVWLAGTHKTNDRLMERGIVSGWINKNKEIVYIETEGKIRGSFTTHSFQGLTIEKGKVFVSLDCFEYAMLYTAVSRCVDIDQLVIVSC